MIEPRIVHIDDQEFGRRLLGRNLKLVDFSGEIANYWTVADFKRSEVLDDNQKLFILDYLLDEPEETCLSAIAYLRESGIPANRVLILTSKAITSTSFNLGFDLSSIADGQERQSLRDYIKKIKVFSKSNYEEIAAHIQALFSPAEA